jgi:PAS domain S-box-containing protein
VSDIVHPDHSPSLRDAITAAVESDSAGFQVETSYLRSDGQPIPTITNVACVRSPEARLDYFIAHMVDLSDLHEAEERFRLIVNSSPDVLIVVDGAGVIELASARVADMFDYEPDDLVGQPVEVLVPDGLRAVHQSHRMSHQVDVAREMGSGLELRGRRSDGSEFPVEISLSPIVMGRESKVLATVRDVTKRLQGEAATRELSKMRYSQRRAIEINDNIVQGLTVARWSFDLGDVDRARNAVEGTVEAARLLVDRMLSTAGDIEPGSLRRELPVGPES